MDTDTEARTDEIKAADLRVLARITAGTTLLAVLSWAYILF